MTTLTRSYAFSPISGRAVRWPTLWYPLHEVTGTRFAERLNDGPSLQMQNGPLTEASRYGSIRLNAAGSSGNQFATTAIDGAALQRLFSLERFAGQHLLLGMELEAESAVSAGGLLGWGQVGGGAGGWALRLGNSASRPLELLIRGVDAGAAAVSTVIPAMPRGASSRHAIVVECLGIDDLRLSVRVCLRPFAPANSDPDRDIAEPVDARGNGTAPPAGDPGIGFTVGAQRMGAADIVNPLRGAWLGNVWAQRRSGVDESLALRACLDMVDAPREFPACLRG